MTQFRGIDPINEENWVIATVKRNPEAFLVMAAGCVLLLRSGSSSPRGGSARYSMDTASNQNRWSDMKERAAASASGLKNQAADAAAAISDQVSGYASSLSEGATAMSERAADYASSASDQMGEWRRNIAEQATRVGTQARGTIEQGFSRMLREQPLAVAALGVAAGAAVAALLPPTEVEQEALRPVRNAAADAAAAAKSNLADAALAAGDQLKEGAEQRGLGAETLKGLAREVADTFTGKISGKSAPAPAPASTQAEAEHG